MKNNISDQKLRKLLGALAGLALLAAGFGAWFIQSHADPAPTAGYKVVTLAELGDFKVIEKSLESGMRQNPAAWPTPTPTTYPASILALNKAKVVVPGYMMPYDQDADGRITSFMLVRSVLVCCFGQAPRLNEVVLCQAAPGQALEYASNVPMRAYGALEVGELREYGQVQALYRMKIDRIEYLYHADPSLQPLPPGMKIPTPGPKP